MRQSKIKYSVFIAQDSSEKLNICIQGHTSRLLLRTDPETSSGFCIAKAIPVTAASQALIPNEIRSQNSNSKPNPNQCHVIYGVERAEFLESNSFPRQTRLKWQNGIRVDSTANLSSLCRGPNSHWKRDRDTNQPRRSLKISRCRWQ